jgi:hypothetical protein
MVDVCLSVLYCNLSVVYPGAYPCSCSCPCPFHFHLPIPVRGFFRVHVHIKSLLGCNSFASKFFSFHSKKQSEVGFVSLPFRMFCIIFLLLFTSKIFVLALFQFHIFLFALVFFCIFFSLCCLLLYFSFCFVLLPKIFFSFCLLPYFCFASKQN